MESIENTIQINLEGLKSALKELGIEIVKTEDMKVFIKAGEGVYLSRNRIKKKRIVVSDLLPNKQLEPEKFGFEARSGEGLLILLQPIKELHPRELSFMGNLFVCK